VRRLALLAVALCLGVGVVAGCGGGGGANKQEGLVSGTSSAGEAENYEPTGKIIADNGFRPDPDGFSFENYPNFEGGVPENLTAGNMYDLFGDIVCIRGQGTSCELTPTAQKWMDTENQRMAGGHCMGFSVAALRFYARNLPTSPFGAGSTFDLSIRDNLPLQSLIAENWVFQDLPTVQSTRVIGAPSDVLRALIHGLGTSGETSRESAYKSLSEGYTLGIFKADGSGGHAITPYAVEDQGGGEYAILVYDNNFPGITRAVDVDTNANTWHYVGGTNPSDTDEVYTGDADTENMLLFPTTPGLRKQPCPFCSGQAAASGQSTGSVLPQAKQYYEITLTGSPTNHAHLVLTDGHGHFTGLHRGRYVNQIPGAQIVTTLSNKVWAQAPEPAYRVPTDTIVGVVIDARDLEKPDKESITLIGPGLYTAVEEIHLKPGDHDVIAFGGGGRGFVYRTTAGHASTPGLALGLEENGVGYAMGVAAAGTKGGSQIALYTHPNGTLTWDTEGTRGAAYKGFAIYVVEIARLTKTGNAVWSSKRIVLKKGWKASLDYRHAVAGKPITVFAGPPGHVVLKQRILPGERF